MAKCWTHVRITAATQDVLLQAQKHLERSQANGSRQLELDARGRLSLDQVIMIAAGDFLKHVVRGRNSRRKKPTGE